MKEILKTGVTNSILEHSALHILTRLAGKESLEAEIWNSTGKLSVDVSDLLPGVFL